MSCLSPLYLASCKMKIALIISILFGLHADCISQKTVEILNVIEDTIVKQEIIFKKESKDTLLKISHLISEKYGNQDRYYTSIINNSVSSEYTLVLENKFVDELSIDIFKNRVFYKKFHISNLRRHDKHYIELNISPVDTINLEVFIKNRPQYNIPTFIYKSIDYEDAMLRHKFITGLFFGAFFLFLVFSLGSFLVSNRSIYLALSGYIVFSNLFHLAEQGVSIPFTISEKLLYFSVFAGLAFLVRLSHVLSPARRFHAFFHGAHIIIIGFAVLMILILLTNIYDINLSVFAVFYESLSLFGVCCYVFVFIRALFYKTTPFLYRLLLFSYGFLVVGFMIKPLSFLGIVDYGDFTKYSAMMGQVVELLCLIGFLIIESFYVIRKSNKIKDEVRDLERSALQAQMNPHFIFNTLNSIQNFIMDNEKDKAMDYLSRFAKLVRQNLNASVDAKVSVAAEVSMLHNYLELEQLRHKDAFSFDISVHDNINQIDTFIGPLLIQPFVENAVIHGINQTKSNSHIQVNLNQKEEFLFVEIIDNGSGFDCSSEANKKDSMGMKITQKRLQHINEYDGDGYTISSNSASYGTKVSVKIKTLGS